MNVAPQRGMNPEGKVSRTTPAASRRPLLLLLREAFVEHCSPERRGAANAVSAATAFDKGGIVF